MDCMLYDAPLLTGGAFLNSSKLLLQNGQWIEVTDNVTVRPSGCRIVGGGITADNSAAAAGGSGGLSRGSALSESGMWLGISELPAGHHSAPHHHEASVARAVAERAELHSTSACDAAATV